MLGNRVAHRSARAFKFTQIANCYNKGSITARQRETGMPATVPVPELVQSVPELEEEQPTKITGTIPEWLEGTILRNGVGQWDLGGETVNHWFDGHAFLHKFEIKNGSVRYLNKFLRSDVYKKNTKFDRWILPGYGTPTKYSDPCLSLFDRFASYFRAPRQNDNCNVNLMPIGDKVFAMTETTAIREVDPKTLETGERLAYNDYMTIHTATAHPHVLPGGEFLNMGSSFGKKTCYNVIQVDSSGDFNKMKIVAKFPATNPKCPSYYHSFGLTRDHILFLEMPYRINMLKMLTRKFTNAAPAEAMFYDKEVNSSIRIADLKTGDILPIKISTEGMGSFHFGNAYEIEADGGIFCVWDACPNYKAQGAAHLFNIETLRSRSAADIDEAFKEAGENELARFVFPIKLPQDATVGEDLNKRLSGKLKTTASAVLKEDGSVWLEKELLIDNSDEKIGFYGFEFPRYNYALNGLPYSYLYGNGFGTILPDRIIKVNVNTKEMKVWQEKDIFPSEPVFVQNKSVTDPSAPGNEDNGVILSICVSTRKDIPAFLVILDAKTLTEVARCTTTVTGLPYGFHHTFLPSDF